MKKSFLFFAVTAVFSVLLTSGCNKDNGLDRPGLSLVSQDDIVVPAEGGEFSFAYTVSNPVEDGTVEASSEAEWISDVLADGNGNVSFTVAANSGEAREADINIAYVYNMGVDSSSIVVKVRQNAYEELYPNAFSISVSNITTNSADVRISCNYSDLYWTASVVEATSVENIIGGKDALESYLNSTFQYNASLNGKTLSEYLQEFLNPGDAVIQQTVYDLTPETVYCIYAIGVDTTGEFLTAAYWADDFTTLAEEVIDPDDGPYATAAIDTYWLVEDIAEYNPDYSFYMYDGPYIAAISYELNDLAAGAQIAFLAGDRTVDWSAEELIQYAKDAGRNVTEGSPEIIWSINETGKLTVVALAYDSQGNYGAEFISVLDIAGLEPSSDMQLFEDMRNAYLGL